VVSRRAGCHPVFFAAESHDKNGQRAALPEAIAPTSQAVEKPQEPAPFAHRLRAERQMIRINSVLAGEERYPPQWLMMVS